MIKGKGRSGTYCARGYLAELICIPISLAAKEGQSPCEIVLFSICARLPPKCLDLCFVPQPLPAAACTDFSRFCEMLQCLLCSPARYFIAIRIARVADLVIPCQQFRTFPLLKTSCCLVFLHPVLKLRALYQTSHRRKYDEHIVLLVSK